MLIIILVIALILIFLLSRSRKEQFSCGLSIVDPFSLALHKDISEKADRWNYNHNRKLYYYRDLVPIRYKE